jgi:hypothetical protein
MSPLRAWTGSVAAQDRRPFHPSPRWTARPAGSSPLPLRPEHHRHRVVHAQVSSPVHRAPNPRATPSAVLALPSRRQTKTSAAPTGPLTGRGFDSAEHRANLLGLEAPAAPHAGTRRLTGHFDRAWLRIFSPSASSIHPPHHHPTLSYHSAYHRGGSLGADHPPKNNIYFLPYNFLPKPNLTT